MTSEPNTTDVKKSTLLLILTIICLVNTALVFRAGVNTLYFLDDPSEDYAPVTGTVISIRETTDPKEVNTRVMVPTFSFLYREKMMEREAPALQWTAVSPLDEPYRVNQQVSLWVHKYRGEIILPPQATQQSIGISQLVVAGLSLVQAMVFWWLRGYLYQKKRKRQAMYGDNTSTDVS